MRQEPVALERQASRLQIGHDIGQILPDRLWQHEAVMQGSAPAHQLAVIGPLPEPGDQGAQQELLGQAHAGMGRHLEGAELDQAEPAGRTVRAVELVDADLGTMGVAGDVDQQIAQNPVDQPGRHRRAVRCRDLGQRQLELVELVLARLVEPGRLAGRADEQAREQIGQGRMVLPVGDQAGQQIRPAQERAVRGAGAADHHVVAAAGADMAAIQHELLGAEPAVPRILVQAGGDRDHVRPAPGRVDVDLEHARIGRHLDHAEAGIGGRPIAFHLDRQAQLERGLLDRRQQLQIVLERLGRRHEHAQAIGARLDRERRPHLGPVRLAVAVQPLLDQGLARRHAGAVVAPHPLAQRVGGWQGGARRERIGRQDIGVVGRRHIRQGRQRQPIADRRVARRQQQTAGAGRPQLALPARLRPALPALDRQRDARRPAQAMVEHPREASALERVLQLGILGRQIGRQLPFAADEMPGILIGRLGKGRIDTKLGRDISDQGQRLLELRRRRAGQSRHALRGGPERLAIIPPIDAVRPARQLLARIPLALAVVEQALRREAGLQPAD